MGEGQKYNLAKLFSLSHPARMARIERSDISELSIQTSTANMLKKAETFNYVSASFLYLAIIYFSLLFILNGHQFPLPNVATIDGMNKGKMSKL